MAHFRWCFWLRNPSGQQQSGWSEQQTLGHSFNSVEDFWCLVNNITNPFDTSNGSNANIDYSIFRKDVKPDYDGDEFKNGGRIILKLNVKSNTPVKLYDGWIHVLLALIGESYDEIGSQCCVGLRLVIKRSNVKFEIWTVDKETTKIKTLTEAFIKLITPIIQLNKPQAEFESFDKSVTFKVAVEDSN
ncbi:putative eukaryotic translation initiation factor 4E [Gregarina niphandrodes]|uniref:Eukaryotic translation initiation factor 4E n=1 Tax=Gregarina niphandrodes TaxID=110365 RepID=A0A023B1V2_GRENI|nr:putative eukaryotic translation initiation factor 4E [Gregarina niphandrodes]EZG48334.1 putative eukaryotic translation initiation factor 4E [Gregarina niphandrodes]|eukprot:XP_011132104.1 putative eukaryotic translation initiation factor 4E [Gregarina niphandrodes]